MALAKLDAVELVFPDGEAPIAVTGVSVLDSTSAQQDGMQFGGLELTITAIKQGTAVCEEVILRQQDGSEEHRKFGRLVFDVGPVEPESTALDTFSGPTLATSPKHFAYAWGRKDENAMVTAIQYGENMTIMDSEQITDDIGQLCGSISLDEYEAPLIYIKAKVTVQDKDGTHIEYAKGCYCGTDFDAVDIETSRMRNAVS